MRHMDILRSVVCALTICFASHSVALAAPPLKFKVTIQGTHDVDWTYHLKVNTGPDGYADDAAQEGTEFVDYDSKKTIIMVFKQSKKNGLVGTVEGKGIDKFPLIRASVTNSNVTSYSCTGKCPPPPDLTPLRSGCGSKNDSAHVKLTYEFGTFAMASMRISDMPGISGVSSPLPPGFSPSSYYLPIGVMYPTNCGPSFPPNNPAQDLVDFRYPFLFESNSNLLPGKPSSAVDKKLKNLKVGKSLTVTFGLDITPAKNAIAAGTGYSYEGQTSVFWKLKFKRIS